MTHSTNHGEQPVPRKRMKEQIDRSMLVVTVASTIVAVVAAAAAVWTGYEAHKTRVADERPFVAVDISVKNPEPNAKSVYGLTTANLVAFGKSPAFKLNISCEIIPDPSERDVWSPASTTAYTIPFILPSRSQRIYICPLVEPQRVRDFYGATFIVLGLATYEDESGNNYRTPFCTRFGFASDKTVVAELCEKSFGLPDLK